MKRRTLEELVRGMSGASAADVVVAAITVGTMPVLLSDGTYTTIDDLVATVERLETIARKMTIGGKSAWDTIGDE